MFGNSWGGSNSLQIATLAPEPLKAIVTLCSTDDRYDNDVHYRGGSVLAVDMHAWATPRAAGLDAGQREEDAHSACFECEVGEETWVLGQPRVRLRPMSEVPRGQIAGTSGTCPCVGGAGDRLRGSGAGGPHYSGTRVYPDGLEISGDRHGFVTSNQVICNQVIYMEGEEVVFHLTWEKRTPRTAG